MIKDENNEILLFALLIIGIIFLLVFPVILFPLLYVYSRKYLVFITLNIGLHCILINILTSLPLFILFFSMAIKLSANNIRLGIYYIGVYSTTYMLIAGCHGVRGFRGDIFKPYAILATLIVILVFVGIKVIRKNRGLKMFTNDSLC